MTTSPIIDIQPEPLPCPFCATALTIIDLGQNPLARCDTSGCWMSAQAISIPLDDPKRITAWNTRLTSTTPILGDMAQEQRLRMFLEILSASCGQADASDYRWNWINVFCDEHEGREPDTFNLAEQRGYTTVSHNTDTDEGMVYLTDAGRAFLSAAPASPILTSVANEGERHPQAYLKEWMVDGEERLRVDLTDKHEAWLTALNPTITPLYALSPALDSPWYPFIVGGQIRLMETGMAPAKAWELSRKTCHAFVREQKISFGDPAFDWSAAGGRTVVEDWEIEHWEHSA